MMVGKHTPGANIGCRVPQRTCAFAPLYVAALLAVLLLPLSACGASGSGSSARPVLSPIPTAVNANLTVYARSDALYALRASDGTLRWKLAVGSGISSPVLVDGVLYVGTDGAVEALDASTRALLWHHPINTWLDLWPTVVDGVVYVSSAQPQKNGPDIKGFVYALRASDGTLLWQYQTGANIFVPPTVSGGVVYVGSGDDHLYALRAMDGTLLWRVPVPWSQTGAVAGDGVVYVGSEDNNLFALRASDGTLLWRYQTGRFVESAPALANGVVYVGSADGFLYALDARTGALRWRAEVGSRMGPPAISDGVVYVGAYSGSLLSFDASTGALRWRYQGSDCSLPCAYFGASTIVEGVVYVGVRVAASNLGNAPQSGVILAFDAPGGSVRWMYKTPTDTLGGIFGSVVVAP